MNRRWKRFGRSKVPIEAVLLRSWIDGQIKWQNELANGWWLHEWLWLGQWITEQINEWLNPYRNE